MWRARHRLSYGLKIINNSSNAEIIERLEEEKTHMNQLMEQSTVREKIDTDFVNQLMIDIRKKQLGDI